MPIRVLAIIVLGFIAFCAMLTAPFRILDDHISIVENPAIKSAQNIPGIFHEGYFHDRSYYRPLINLSFMGEFKLFGFDPFYFNLDNLLLHIINALLVFLLVTRLTNNGSIGFWTGLLFVIHPVQWEAVCNISGRSILLSAFFILSSFVLFLGYYKNHRWGFGLMVLITFFLALLCKESSGMLPFVVIAYLSLDQTRSWRQKSITLWPYGIAIAGYVMLRYCFGITDIHQASGPFDLFFGFVTFLRSVITDLRLFVLPLDLHFDRSLPLIQSLAQPQAIGTFLFWFVALIDLVLFHRRIQPFILFLIGWFCLELLPVSQLVSAIKVGAGRISTAEHFLYLACIPFFIALVTAFQWCYAYNTKTNFIKPQLIKFLAGGFLTFLFLTAVEQSIYASNEFNMISRSLGFEGDNPRLQAEMGMLSVFRNDIPSAQKYFEAAIKAEPFNPFYHICLGTSLCQQAQWIRGLEQFVALDPGKDKDLAERQEKLTMPHIRQQLAEGKTFDFRGWLAIGIYYAKFGQVSKAIDAFLKCVSLKPDQTDAWFNLGSLYESQNNWPAARMAYKKLLGLPDLTAFQRDYASKHLAEMGER